MPMSNIGMKLFKYPSIGFVVKFEHIVKDEHLVHDLQLSPHHRDSEWTQ